MKLGKTFWGLLLIFLALFLLFDSIGLLAPIKGVFGEISVFRLGVGILLIASIVSLLSKWNWQEIFVPLAFLFMVFEKNIATLIGASTPDLISNWLLLVCAFLLSAGLSILFPRHRRRKHFRIHTDGGRNHHSNNLGSGERYIDCSRFRHELVENNLGHYEVRFDNVEAYRGGATLEVENNLGEMSIYVPSAWNVDVRIDHSLGSVNKVGLCTQNGPDLTITGDCNLGSVTVYMI